MQPGGGRIVACLKAHKDSLSDQCKKAAGLPVNPSISSAPSAPSASPASETPVSEAPASAPAASPSAPGPSASFDAKSSQSSGVAPKAAAATGTGSGSYLRMKTVQLIAPVVDRKLGNGKDPVNLPVLDLLIPSTWDFKSNVAFNTTSHASNWGCRRMMPAKRPTLEPRLFVHASNSRKTARRWRIGWRWSS